jgi:hypothetical protein
MRNAARTERASLTTPIFNFVTTPSRRRGPWRTLRACADGK